MERFNRFDQFADKKKTDAGSDIRELDDKKLSNIAEYEYRDFRKQAKGPSDSNFELNPFVKQSLSIEEEIEQRIQEQVELRLRDLSAEVRKQAFEQGYEDGKKQGFQESFNEFKKESEAHLQKIQDFISTCDEAKDTIYRQNEKFLIDLIFRVGQTVLLKELQMDREYLGRLVKELIQELGVKDSVTIKLNPEDAAFVQTLKSDLLLRTDTLKNVTIELSDEVKMGGCMVETDWNAVDASVKTQLDRLHQAITGKTEPEV